MSLGNPRFEEEAEDAKRTSHITQIHNDTVI